MFNYLKRYFSDWNAWDYSWVIVSSIIGTWLGIHWGEGGWQTWLSVITMLTGLWCVILVAKGRILNYYIGIINILGYAYIAYTYELYGEVQLNLLYYLPMSIIGIWMWLRNKNTMEPDMVSMRVMTWVQKLHWFGIAFVGVFFYSMYLKTLGDPLPLLDATSTVLSVFGMYLLVQRYMEQWLMWIAVDVVSIVMWVLTIVENGNADIAILVMWLAFLINAVYGYVSWSRLELDQRIRAHEEEYGTPYPQKNVLH
jgi:nicotinamide mononucleotide transporter